MYRGVASGDYDSYTSVGYYMVAGGMTANKPDNSGSNYGYLMVYGFGDNGITMQMYMATSSRAFIRGYAGNPAYWSAWKEL